MTNTESNIYEYMRLAHHPNVNSILFWEHGELNAECYFNGYNKTSRHSIKSVVKSILSIAIGIAQDDGLLNIEDPIYKYIPEFNEMRDPRHRTITIHHLLTMSSGIFWNGGVHYHCPMLDALKRTGNWKDFIADIAVKDRPGSSHNYKEWDVMLISAVLSSVTGDCYDFIEDRLYRPLGITSDRWEKSLDGVYYSPALERDKKICSDLTARDMLKIGILFLQNGMWDGKRILSEKYIKDAVSPSPQDEGYGLLWWRGDDWYGCRGFGGQSITVFPDKNRVVVTQATATNRPLAYNDIIFGDFETSVNGIL